MVSACGAGMIAINYLEVQPANSRLGLEWLGCWTVQSNLESVGRSDGLLAPLLAARAASQQGDWVLRRSIPRERKPPGHFRAGLGWNDQCYFHYVLLFKIDPGLAGSQGRRCTCKKGQNRLGPSLETGYHSVFIIFISFSVKYLFISLVSFFIGLF